MWEGPTGLKFREQKSGKVHIEIRFERKNHGDDDPFDGLGGVYGHSFFPVYGGDVHFDDEEDWTVNTPRGTSLLMAATHLLGHSLGLSHSDVRSALMYPFYRGYMENISLDQDDIQGIQALYDDFDNTELCEGKLDTIVMTKDNATYAFYGDKYWKVTDTSIAPGYPRSISADWDGLPSNLDAAITLTYNERHTYFFKGDKYWRFSEIGKLDMGYPKVRGFKLVTFAKQIFFLEL